MSRRKPPYLSGSVQAGDIVSVDGGLFLIEGFSLGGMLAEGRKLQVDEDSVVNWNRRGRLTTLGDVRKGFWVVGRAEMSWKVTEFSWKAVHEAAKRA